MSVISWRSVLLVEETTDLWQVTDKLYYIMLYQVHLAWVGFELTMLVAIGTDCIGSYKSNHYTITITMTPQQEVKVFHNFNLPFIAKHSPNLNSQFFVSFLLLHFMKYGIFINCDLVDLIVSFY